MPVLYEGWEVFVCREQLLESYLWVVGGDGLGGLTAVEMVKYTTKG